MTFPDATHSQPADELTRHTLDRLDSLLVHDNSVAQQLLEAEATVEKYRRKRAKIQDKIFLYRATIAPVRRIPVEVLTHIFKFLFLVSPDTISQVGQVCRLWRNVIMLPELWTNIVINKDSYPQLVKVMLFLSRSAKLPVRVTYGQSVDPTSRFAAWKGLVREADRWSHLSLILDDCRAAASLISSLASTPLLKELSIAIRRQSPCQASEGNFGFESYDVTHSPLLRTLSLFTFVLPRPGGLFSRLTGLHITDTFADLVVPMNGIRPIRAKHILYLLYYCPHLEDFSFDGERSYHSFTSVDLESSLGFTGPGYIRVALPKLRHLCIKCHKYVGDVMVTHILAENLETATLRLFPRHEVQNDTELGRAAAIFVIRCPRLRSLSVYGLDRCVVLGSSIRALEHLEELHLEHVLGLDLVADRFAVEHQVSNKHHPIWYAPKLSSLILDANWFDVPFDKFATVIKERYRASLRNGAPTRIRRYVVNGQNMLKGAAAGEVVEYERPRRFCKPYGAKKMQ